MTDDVGTSANISVGDETLDLDVLTASLGSGAVDISKLRGSLNTVTYDPGFANTANTRSSIRCAGSTITTHRVKLCPRGA